MEIENEKFELLLEQAWQKIPSKFRDKMDNVSIVIEPRPTPEQLKNVVDHGTLLGLFDGMPITAWGQASMGVQPSKISIFQETILNNAHNEIELQNLLQEVLMHEVGHYFGYNDDAMMIMDSKLRKKLSK